MSAFNKLLRKAQDFAKKNPDKVDQVVRKAQNYAQKNPDKISKYADKAGDFVNKQTKGKYADRVDGALNKLDSFTGQRRDTDGRDTPGPTGGPASH